MDLNKDAERAQNTEEQLFMQLLEQYRIRANDKYADKEYLLEREGIGFAPRGNVCALTAEKKAGKSWFAMAMCAAYLNGSYLGMQSRRAEDHVPHVLYFDTEQDAGDGQRIQRRVHYACGWDFETDCEQFKIFHLREIPASERRKVVNDAIKFLPCDLVIVDGIRDLLSDFNDLEESAAVIQDHMQLSSEKQCCIFDVLHVNPSSEKMRGHLGTELGNKVADILYMTKKKDPNDEDNTYKMEETDARSHKDIKSITFRINDGLPYGAPQLLSEAEVAEIEEDRENEIREILDNIMGARAMSKTALREAIKHTKNYGTSKADKLIEEAKANGILETVIQTGKLRVCHSVKVKDDELPFMPPE